LSMLTFSETAGSVQDDRAEKPVAIMEFEMSHPSAEDALETGKREVTSALSNAHGRRAPIAFVCRLGRSL